MMEFDAYLMVDWGANSRPKTGQDSIWYCMVARTANALRPAQCGNPRTRYQAIELIRDLLQQNVKDGISTLVGFDFPYGYPAGSTAALGLRNSSPWRAVWRTLSEKIKDDLNNKNNRFAVAAELNKRMSGEPYPFWGCPRKYLCSTLSPKRSASHSRCPVPEYRITELRAKPAQSAWKLFGAGSVGSQALLGIPHVARLRDDSCLASVSRIWPFETGLTRLPKRPGRDWLILHAEIYPGIIKSTPREGEVKDEAQVHDLAMYFAHQDGEGSLAEWFEVPKNLSDKERWCVEAEEGWILGVH